MYGLPREYAPDEGAKVEVGLHLAEKHFIHPGHHPGFLYNSLFLVIRAARPFYPFFQRIPFFQKHFDSPFHPKPYLIWVGRCWMALLSSLTIFVLFFIGRRVWNERAGLFAAFLFALDPLSIAATHYIKEDTPLTLFMALTVLACLALMEKRRWRDALFAGLAAGFCLGSKYPGIVALPFVILACLLTVRHPEERHPGRRFRVLLIPALGGFIAGFLVTTPAILLQHRSFFTGISFQTQYIVKHHYDNISIPLWESFGVFYLAKAVVPAVGAIGIIAAIAGGVLVWEKNKRPALLLAVWTAGYYLLVEAMPTKPYPFFARYILPVIAGMAVLIGILCDRLWREMLSSQIPDRRENPSFRRVLLHPCFWILFLVLFIPMERAVLFSRSIYPDTRVRAGHWMRENIPPPSRVFHSWYSPVFHDSPFEMIFIDSGDMTRAAALHPDVQIYVVMASLWYQRFLDNPEDNPYDLERIMDIFQNCTLIQEFRPSFPPLGFHNPTVRIYRVPGEHLRKNIIYLGSRNAPGVSREISILPGQTCSPWFGKGWSQPEIWTKDLTVRPIDGARGTLLIPLDEPASFTLSLRFYPFKHDVSPPLTLAVSCNGIPLQKSCPVHTGVNEVLWNIPPDLLEKGINRIDLVPNRTLRPCDFNPDSGDSRRLSIWLERAVCRIGQRPEDTSRD